MLPTKTLNPSGRIFLDNCYLFLLVNSPAINSQKKLRIFLKKIATQHKIEPLANPKSRRKQSSLCCFQPEIYKQKNRIKRFSPAGFPYGKFSDENFLRARARGFCLSVLRTSNKNIAPPFESRRNAKQLALLQAHFLK